MATYGTGMRRGLPRTTGGDPWPPGGAASASTVVAEPPVIERAERDEAPPALANVVAATSAAAATSSATGQSAVAEPVQAPAVPPTAIAGGPALRRGLERVRNGQSVILDVILKPA